MSVTQVEHYMSHNVLIVYHTQSVNTEKLARVVEQGVIKTESVRAVLKRVSDATAQDARDCNAIAICSPEYFRLYGRCDKRIL